MTISVIVPVLNEAARIDRCLRDLENRNFSEIVVVDGGSHDGTVELVKSHSRVHLVETKPGRGIQLDTGARAASGRVLLFLHADVTLPDRACEIIREILMMPNTVAGAFRTWTIAERSRGWRSVMLHLADIRSRYAALPYGDQGLFLTARNYRCVGGYPDLRSWKTWSFRAACGVTAECKSPSKVFGYRVDDLNLRRSSRRCWSIASQRSIDLASHRRPWLESTGLRASAPTSPAEFSTLVFSSWRARRATTHTVSAVTARPAMSRICSPPVRTRPGSSNAPAVLQGRRTIRCPAACPVPMRSRSLEIANA